MFRIKICGVRSLAAAEAVVAAGGDAIGLNFYSKSRRSVGVEEAAVISRQLEKAIQRVGVFVNMRVPQIKEVAAEVGLDIIQLHGDEPPETIAELPTTLAVVRAFRMGPDRLLPLQEYLQRAGEAGRRPDAVLVDAHAPGSYGGTGIQADWNGLEDHPLLLGGIPMILAGGLHAENVGAAIAQVRPFGVDTASGVEGESGLQDETLIADFCRSAREHLAQEPLDGTEGAHTPRKS